MCIFIFYVSHLQVCWWIYFFFTLILLLKSVESLDKTTISLPSLDQSIYKKTCCFNVKNVEVSLNALLTHTLTHTHTHVPVAALFNNRGASVLAVTASSEQLNWHLQQGADVSKLRQTTTAVGWLTAHLLLTPVEFIEDVRRATRCFHSLPFSSSSSCVRHELGWHSTTIRHYCPLLVER